MTSVITFGLYNLLIEMTAGKMHQDSNKSRYTPIVYVSKGADGPGLQY